MTNERRVRRDYLRRDNRRRNENATERIQYKYDRGPDLIALKEYANLLK
jgi:hypothetical protein